jgi:hypothetical protein
MKTIASSCMMVATLFASACGDDSPPPYGVFEQAGQSCTDAAQCYPDVPAGALHGDPICLDQARNGYCTHTCESDADCCAVAGECRTALPQVCTPYESSRGKYCFLSCEDSDVRNAGFTDAATFCHTYANAAFECKSSGGGAQNRKICVP